MSYTKDRESGIELKAGTACGKVILLGEHAVVYGIPAIAVGIDRGANASATALYGESVSRLRVRGWGVEVKEDDKEHDLARAFSALLQITREDDPEAVMAPILIEASADLPPGGGLGCSAALGVAVARAIDGTADSDTIAHRVMAWERVFHGNPSGVDAAVSARGGCVLFEKGLPLETVHVRGGLTLCIGSTGIASSTKSMVDAVARYHWRRPEIVDKAFEGVRALVRNAVLALEAGDRFALGRLMDLNQMILSGLFVSTQEIETMCGLARTAGAMGAKLTGAGGGGSVVALVNGMAGAERVLESWQQAGFSGFATRVFGSEPMAIASGESPR